jgi:hypothetical protein
MKMRVVGLKVEEQTILKLTKGVLFLCLKEDDVDWE